MSNYTIPAPGAPAEDWSRLLDAVVRAGVVPAGGGCRVLGRCAGAAAGPHLHPRSSDAGLNHADED